MASGSAARIALVMVVAATPAVGADWQLVRGNERARLSVDRESIKRNGDEASFRYLIDLRQGEGAKHGSPDHRSIVTQARVRCKERTIAIGDSEGFLVNGGQGAAISRSAPKKGPAVFAPLEKGSSDEDLWKHLCAPPAPEQKKK